VDTMILELRLLLAAGVLLSLPACTAERQVLDNPSGVVTTCDQVWNGSQPGAACAFTDRCTRATPAEPTCCTDVGLCTNGALELSQSCRPECNCSDDSACTFGEAICEGRCQACPSTDLCPACPADWVPLARNGCPTCRCGPASRCDVPDALCDPGAPAICYAGASCAAGCDASVPGCCSNTCAERGCTAPAPLGCLTTCPAENGCALCATTACTCLQGRWECTAVCVENVTFDCRYP